MMQETMFSAFWRVCLWVANQTTVATLIACLLTSGCAAWRERLNPQPNLSEERAARHADTLESFEQHRDRAQLAAAVERFEHGDLPGCHSRLTTLLERRPDLLEARLRLAEVSWALDDAAAAEAGYAAVLAAQPDHAEARHGLGMLLLAQGRFEEGHPHLRRAAELDPENVAYRQAALP